LTLPGAYFAFVSIPLFQLILLRRHVRLLVWLQLLWRISRLDLHQVPTHPDRMGGTPDIQSLADLSNSYDVIRGMQPFAFGRSTLIRLAVATLLPIVPLVLTMIPFEQLLDRLLKTLL